MKDKTCNECETWQKKKWNFCNWFEGCVGGGMPRPCLTVCLPLAPGLAPYVRLAPILLLSFGRLCGAGAICGVSSVLAAAVSESRGQQPSQAAAAAAAVAAATFHQCQLGIKLKRLHTATSTGQLDEKSTRRAVRRATLPLCSFATLLSSRFSFSISKCDA